MLEKLKQIWQSKFVKNVLTTYLTRFSGVFLGLLTTVLSSRAVGPEGRGWMACAFNISYLGCAFGCFGLNVSNLVLGAKLTQQRAQLVGNSLSISFFASVILAAILLSIQTISPELIPLPGVFMAATIVYTFLLLVYTTVQSLLYAFDMIKICNWQEFFSKLLIFAITIGLCWLGIGSPAKFFAAFLIGIGLAAIWRLYSAYSFAGQWSLFSWKLFCQSASYNFKAFLFSAFYSAIQMADILIIQYCSGPEQSGYYNIVGAIRSLTLAFTLIVNQMLLPRLSAKCKTIRDCLPMVWKANAFFLVFNIILATILAIFMPWCINLILGPEFAPSSTMLMWMLPGIIFFNGYTILTTVFNLAGQPYSATLWLAACTALDLFLCYYWNSRGGLGAAQAFSCASFMLFSGAWLHTLLYKYTNSGLQELDTLNK